jgi:hypothetical protein
MDEARCRTARHRASFVRERRDAAAQRAPEIPETRSAPTEAAIAGSGGA